MTWTIHNGDCLEVMATLEASSVDAIVSDPPYGLSFMGKGWDHGVPGVEFWREALRVAKPGCHLLAFGGTRTYHRLACAIEDAGWEIRDCLGWLYGSGFPKSLDVSKAIDKAAGAEREKVRTPYKPGLGSANTVGGDSRGEGRPWIDRAKEVGYHEHDSNTPATEAAKQWQGWGTALKPAWEPIIMARKPLCGTVAENVLTHGTGGLNVDGCRVGSDGGTTRSEQAPYAESGWRTGHKVESLNARRWPANIMHDGSEEAIQPMGEASRFFYCAKASKADRDEDNRHPTVKPTELMRYLCRLVTPPGGAVLDPFTGSGSTGKAAILERFNFIGIERESEYCEIARARIGKAERDVSKELI